MIIYQRNSFIYFEDGSLKFWVPEEYLQLIDIGLGKVRIWIYQHKAREHKTFVNKEYLITDVHDKNDNEYGDTVDDLISGLIPTSGVLIDTNSAIGDAFGRLRTSMPYQLFDSKELDGSQTRIWSEETSGNGTTTKETANSQWLLNAPDNGSFAIRQTKQRFPYQAAKSQLALLTGVMPTVINTRASIGLAEGNQATNLTPFEIYNGVYWQNANDGTTTKNGMHVCISKNGVHNKIHQDDWSVDSMDGTGASGIDADWSKAQIFGFDFEWLGVGRVRFHLNINGVSYIVHEFNHANLIDSVYTKSPNLPVRYEARSIGGDLTVQKICSSIQSEGGVDPAGVVHIGSSQLNSVNNDSAGTNNTVAAILRLQNDRPYSMLKLTSYTALSFANSPLRWSIALVSGSFQIDVNGTPTAIDDLVGSIDLPDTTVNFWEANTSGQDTVLEADISPFTIEEGFLGAGGNQADMADISPVDNLLTVGKEINGSRTAFVLYVQGYGANTMRSALKFKEVI